MRAAKKGGQVEPEGSAGGGEGTGGTISVAVGFRFGDYPEVIVEDTSLHCDLARNKGTFPVRLCNFSE